IEEAGYWRALCKWKKGNVQTSINELTILLESSDAKDIQSKCHLSLAEIAQELKEQDKAMLHLQEGARLTKNRDEKGVIYGRLAEMAFNRNDYELAEDGYSNVIAHSLSKDNVEKAHLQILKILRIQKKYRSASRKIKGMLADDKFNRISGNLELELVQLYRAQGEFSEIETRLESIVNDYQRTLVSSEAYYQLGQIYTSGKWNLVKAKEYFDLVSKESSKSLFSPMAKSRSKAISTYQEAEKDLDSHRNIPIEDDTTLVASDHDTLSTSVSIIIPERTVPELYYQLADLEAFSFSRYPQAIEFLNNIINEYPDSPFQAKSMFALAFVHERMENREAAEEARENLLAKYPTSDYASYLSENVQVETKAQEAAYMQAESQITDNVNNAIQLFKSALALDLKGDLAAPAAFSIGYYYDQTAVIDSAVKYYQWIKENHPGSDQSKQADIRLQTLNMVLSSIAPPDTLESSVQEDN
ncbi:MAG: tetratricopeptide repeat protein, partial [Candidatus Neomarinimicrobiota bacterium]|nr:tetratricopeptide repeat protein [Candidatus Neomarinimicrobiota bacterium]